MEKSERETQPGQNWQDPRISATTTHSASTLASASVSASAPRHHRKNDGPCPDAKIPPFPGAPERQCPDRVLESWVEISSQPSSSSLSSIGEDIVTTGLRVGNSAPARRRRLQQPHPLRQHPNSNQQVAQAGTSSQEEYEESESEEDRVLLSSTEGLSLPLPPPHPLAQQVQADSDSDDDENATALGHVSDQPAFRPQPNAFSHPPGHLAHRSHSTNSSVPVHPHSSVSRPVLPHRSHTRIQRGAPSLGSPSYREDNDAALRASLTTLLSCAAAARGLPKSKEESERHAPSGIAPGVGPTNQPMELMLVPESELMREDTAKTHPGTPGPRSRSVTSSSANSAKEAAPIVAEKTKRSAATQGRPPRATKKKKIAPAAAATSSDESLISPTLLTWMVSAGVVVLVSVVGFGAGYVIGREVGRQEVLSAGAGFNASSVTDSTSCGTEVIRSSSGGLRRLRWGSMGRSITA
jgi:hypothetical protein